MKYPLYNLDAEGFADLAAIVCEHILGCSTIVFTKAKDGGRDAKFTGTANAFPSAAAPWSGKFIIQAKHTTKPTASCTDADFVRILMAEFPKLVKLKKAGKLDYYLLFTNRKLTGLQDPKLEDLVDQSVGVPNRLIGLERIDLWLETHPTIAAKAKLNRLLLPLQFYEDDLRDLVLTLSRADIQRQDLSKIEDEIRSISISEKNALNRLSEDYFADVFKRSVDDFARIRAFLADPRNADSLTMYHNTAADINAQISIHRNDYSAFEELLDYIYRLVLDVSTPALRNNRRLIRAFIHYMYFHCDIGAREKDHA